MKTSVLIIAILVTLVPVCAARDDSQGQDFVSSTLSDIFEKVDKYSSGEKGMLDSENDGAEDTGGTLGRKRQRGLETGL
jgi:hypothetical protein